MFKSIQKAAYSLGLLAGMTSLVFAAQSAAAADLRYNTGRNPNFEVAASDKVTNLYTAGAQVVVNASAARDAVVAGATLQINGNTGDDLIAAGGNVDVDGNVGGSARVVGGNIRINSKSIGQDLVVAGGTVYISADTVVNGDLLVAGGNVYVDGSVKGNVKFNGGNLNLNGAVGGNVDVHATQYFQLGSKADIKGSLNYTSPVEYDRDANAKVAGQVNYTHLAGGGNRANFAALLTIAFLIKLVGALLLAFVLLWLFHNKFTNSVMETGRGFWKNVGIGLVALIVTPIVIVILMFTFIGWYIAAFLGLVYVLVLLLAGIISMSYFGSWFIAKLDKKEMRVDYLTVTLGIVLASVLKLIPLLGWIFVVILVLAGMGVIVKGLKERN